MDKHVKQRLIGRVSWHGQPLTPMSPINNQFHFIVLLKHFDKFQNWKETAQITKEEFESQLENEDLTNAYLDVYFKPARYYKCTVDFQQWIFEHFLMVVNKNIVLIFFREFAKEDDSSQ